MLRLTQKEKVLEERLESVCQENTELKASLASLHTRLALHDQLNQQHSQQVHIQIHDLLVLNHTWTRQHKKWFSVVWCVNERASITKGFPAPGLAAWVSAGLWKALLNNHLIPVIVTSTGKSGFHTCSFGFVLGVSLESGTSGFSH